MITAFQNMTIRNKLISAGTLFAVLIGSFVFILFPYQQKRQILDQSRVHALDIGKMTADNLQASLEFQDRATAREVVAILEENRDFVFVVVRDRKGDVFIAEGYNRARPFLSNHDTLMPVCTVAGDMTVTTMPIRVRGQVIGSLTLGLSLNRINARIYTIMLVALMVSVMIIAVMIAFYFFIGNVIARPIQKAIDVSSSIARGDFTRRLDVTSRDEVGRLAQAFNDMTWKLNKSIGELEKSEENYRLHFENVSDLIFSLNVDLTIVSVSPSVEKLLGYAPVDLVGRNLHEVVFISDDCLSRITSDTRRALAGEEIGSSEYTFVAKDTIRKMFETSMAPLFQEGKTVAVVCVARDVTDRKRVLEELSQTKDFLNNVIESSQDGIVVTDSTAKITMVNRYLLDLLEFEKTTDIAGKYIIDLIPPCGKSYRATTGETIVIDEKLYEDARAINEQLFEEGKVSNWQSYLLARSGVLIPVEQSAVILYSAGGERIGAVGIIRDITARRRAERELREANDFLESVIESSHDGIIISDAEGIILSVNSAIKRITGFGTAELSGKKLSTLAAEDPDMLERIPEKTKELFEKGSASFEIKQTTRDGRSIDLEYSTSMISDEEGTYVAAVSIVRDISERKEMERQLLQSEKLKSLGELAGGVAHDFNNVLVAILGRAQLLRKASERPDDRAERRESVIELQKGLKIIEKAALDGAETVRRIQEFSRRRDEDSYFTTVHINAIIEDAIEFTRVLWKDDAEAKGIHITIAKNLASIPPVAGSASELREVFTNLIKNSIEAMPKGGSITIRTFRDDKHVVIKIEDTGQGIPEVSRDRIFDPFFTTKGPQSTGLGMSVSYGIVSRHKGTIVLDSSVDRGTSFIISFPVQAWPQQPEKAVVHIPSEKEAHILIIDDEMEVRETLGDILTEGGHTIEAASNGEKGIRLFQQGDFDLVFTDLGMPGMSGYQVAEAIKDIDDSVPVFLITGWQVQLSDDELRENGIDFVLNKPFQIQQVLALVQEGLNIREKRRQMIG